MCFTNLKKILFGFLFIGCTRLLILFFTVNKIFTYIRFIINQNAHGIIIGLAATENSQDACLILSSPAKV